MFRRLSHMADTALWLLKWPIAAVALALVPGSAVAFYEVLRAGADRWQDTWPLAAGIAAYWLAWLIVFRRRFVGSAFSTAEHELSHALFALLTCHRVTGFRTSWNSGGEITVIGGRGGNWVIALAPYFFNTLSLLVILASLVVGADPTQPVWSGAIGLTLGYHLTSTLRETHLGQGDLKQVGFLFGAAVLPTFNLLAYGSVAAFALGGGSRWLEFFVDVGEASGSIAGWLVG